MKRILITFMLFICAICSAQSIVVGEENLSDYYNCWSIYTDDNYNPDFKAGALYYRILSIYSDSLVEVYSSLCECDSDVNYSQIDTCIIPEQVIFNGKMYTVVGIGSSVLNNCSRLKKVVLPNTITYISPWAFDDCDSLVNINIPTSLKRVGHPHPFMGDFMREVYKQLPDSIEYVWGVNINPW